MALPLPRLDSRTFDELVRTSVRGIPQRAPAWTDHNAHDPGVTLVELFAWLVEMDLYRLDRTTPALARTYLRLVGIEVAPALAATTHLALHHPTAIALPSGVQMAGGDVTFETIEPIAVSPAQVVSVSVEHDGKTTDHTEHNARQQTYAPFGTDGQGTLALAFDQPFGGGGESLTLHVWTPTVEQDAATKAALETEHARAVEDAAHDCPPGFAVPDALDHDAVSVVWEYWSQSLGWRPLPDVEDETRALTLSGRVRFAAPGDQGSQDGVFPVRCRPRGTFDCAPRIDHLALNVVRARHAATRADFDGLGISNGQAKQRFELAEGPVVPGSLELTVGSDSWDEVRDWDRSGPFDRHVVLDRERGLVTFGDGRVGAVPPADDVVMARYAIGVGDTGNVAAGTLERLADTARNRDLLVDFHLLAPKLQVRQPQRAFGGAEPEHLEQARGRAVAELATPHRATTLDDLERLAHQTPGVPIARTRAIPERYAPLPCLSAAGAVTVVVVPACTEGEPVPSAELLRAVHRYLAPRLPVATELFVVGPRLTEVTVTARLVLEPNTPAGKLDMHARRALEAFLDPRVGGPTGQGWPVGRGVFRTELYELLNDLPCVAWVEDLGIATTGDDAPRCGDLPLCDDSIVVSGAHHIDVIHQRELR